MLKKKKEKHGVRRKKRTLRVSRAYCAITERERREALASRKKSRKRAKGLDRGLQTQVARKRVRSPRGSE